MQPADLPRLSVTELAALLQRREVSLVAVTEAYLARIEYRKCKRPFPLPVCLCPPAARQAAPRSRPAAGSRRIALPRCQARTSRQPGDGPPAPLGLLLGLPGRMVARGRPRQRD